MENKKNRQTVFIDNNKDTAFIGIDPGKTGAIGIILPTKSLVMDFIDPTIPSTVQNLKNGYKIVTCIEKVGAMPGQGVVSMFNFGANYGWWKGILDAYSLPYTTVTPQKWQKSIFKDTDTVLFEKGAKKGKKDRKTMALNKARELFPELSGDLKLKKHDGRADALLIAYYTKLTYIFG